jgi:hypothetical protein
MVETDTKEEGLLYVPSLNGHVSRHVSGIMSKVTLATSPHMEILRQIAGRLSQSESETVRAAFMEYAKGLSVVTEKAHGRT